MVLLKEIMKECRNCLFFMKFRRYFHRSSRHNSTVRVRFAPSPTGQLHLGSLRTALYNYLFAKSKNGKFILRIEDTDQTRKVPGAMENLLQILDWAKLNPDEGPQHGGDYGPYIQSERKHLYQSYIQKLLDNGSAYRCFCTQKRLDLLRKEAMRNREVVKYDGKCRTLKDSEIEEKLNNGVPYTVRLKLSPLMQNFVDLVYGELDIDLLENEGDPIMMKTDNFPTYHFANVVDDHLMQITHVLRGVEWQTSTPKHLMIYQAFGWTPPKYAHLPLIMNADGTKLSKRQGDIHVKHFIEHGYFPESVLNYITIPGGGITRSDYNEILTYDQLVQNFDVNSIKTYSGRLDPSHLERINQKFIQKRIAEGRIGELVELLKSDLLNKYSKDLGYNMQLDELSDLYLEKILTWSQNRISKLEDLLHKDFEFLWLMPGKIDVKNFQTSRDILKSCLSSILDMDQIELALLTSEMKREAKNAGIKYADFMKFLRLCLSGQEVGPSIGEIVSVLGKKKTIQRIQHAISLCEQK